MTSTIFPNSFIGLFRVQWYLVQIPASYQTAFFWLGGIVLAHLASCFAPLSDSSRNRKSVINQWSVSVSPSVTPSATLVA